MDTLLLEVLREFLKLVPMVGIAAPLITLIVNAAKRAGLPDGKAGLLSGVLNLVAWLALAVAAQMGQLVEAQSFVERVTGIAPFVIAIVSSVLASEVAFKLGRKARLPGFGESNEPQ